MIGRQITCVRRTAVEDPVERRTDRHSQRRIRPHHSDSGRSTSPAPYHWNITREPAKREERIRGSILEHAVAIEVQQPLAPGGPIDSDAALIQSGPIAGKRHVARQTAKLISLDS